MKIKLLLNGQEKTLALATVWSLFLTGFLLVVGGLLLYKIAPENVQLSIPAAGLKDGVRTVTLRALSPGKLKEVYYKGTSRAEVKEGILTSSWTMPDELAGKDFIVEICTTSTGQQTVQCFTDVKKSSYTHPPHVAGASTDVLVSCPYYVSRAKPSKIANLLGLNAIDLESRVYCGDGGIGDNASSDFTPYSKIDTIAATGLGGVSHQTGVLTVRDGELVTVSFEDFLNSIEPSTPQSTTSPQVVFQTTPTQSAIPQTLALSGNTLSLSGGNSVTLTSPPTYSLASSTMSGLLSNTDWSIFAAKENSLTFDGSFVRSGDTISLMSCAANEVIKSDGASWLCAQDLVGAGSTTYSAGTGLSLVGTTFNNTGVLGVTATGALSASAGQNPAISLSTSSDLNQLAGQLGLANTGVSAGTYNNVTVDTKGRVTSGTNISYLTTEQDGVVGNEVAGVVTGGGLVMTGTGTSGDPYKLGLVTTCGSGQIMKWNGSAWVCANDVDTDTNTDQQTLSFNPGTGDLSLTNGGTVNLSSLDTDSQTLSVSGSGLLRQLSITGGNTVGIADSDNQSLSLASNTLSLTDGGSVNLAPYLDNTDSQALSIAGNVISLTNGGSITLPADQNTTYSAGNGLSLTGTVFAINAPTCAGTTKLQWNGSSFACASDVDTDTDAQTLSWNNGTRTLTIVGGNSVVISDSDTTYSAGAGITLTGTTFSLTNDFGSSIDSSEITDGTIVAADLANSGATAGTYGDAGVNVAQLTVNAQGQVTAVSNRALPTASTSTTGVLSSADWNTFNGKENVLTFTDGLSRTGNSVSLMDCAASQIIQRNAGDTAWVCANQVVDTNTTYSAGTGLSLVGTTFSNAGVLSVTASGALASSGGQNPAITLAASSDFSQLANQLSLTDTGVTAGTYNNVAVDAKGRVTSGSTISYLTSENDGVVGNEIADVVTNGGLVMTGAGTSGNPYKVGLITTCADNQLLKYTTAGGWACASDIDTDTNTDGQTLTWNTGTNNLSISGGNSVNLSSLLDNTDAQTLSWNGGTRSLSLTNGGSVVISDADTTYSSGNGLSLTGTVFAINAPTCAGTTKLQWNGSAFVCAVDVDTDTDAQTLSWNGGTRTLSIVGGNSVVVPDADTTYSAGTGITLTGTTFSLTNDFGSSIDSSEITNSTIAAADLANSGATAGTYGDSGVNIAQLTVNAQGQVTAVSNRALPTANGTTTGVISSGDWTTFNGKENVLTFSDGLFRSGNTVTLMDCAASQIVQRNVGDTAWVCANQVVDTNTTYSAGTGLSLVGTTFSNTGVLSVGASGALTSSGGQNPAITLATTTDFTQLGNQLGLSTTGVSAGTYNNVTVDAQGRVTNGTNVSYLTSETDGIVGNEVADVALNGGLVMTGAGTSGNPYKVGLITTCADNQLLKYTTAGGWACANDIDTDTNTDAQTLTWNTGTNNLSISGGNSVNLSSLLDNTDSQTLGLAGDTLSLTNGGSVDLSGYLDNTDSQSLSWNGGTRTLSLTNGGSVIISDADTTYSAGTGLTLVGTTFSLTNDFGASIDSSEITNGTIAAADLANSGATAGTYGDSGVNVAQLTVNAQGQVTAVSNRALPTANTTTTGVLSSGDWNTFNGKENVLTFSDGLARNTNTVTLMDCAASQIIQRNVGDTAWVCANQVVDTNTTYSAGTGLSLVGTTFSNSGVLSVGASGALTSSGGQNPAITLATTSDLTQLGSQLGLTATGVSAGTYNNVTVDAQGRVTNGTNISYLTSEVDAVVGNEIADVVVDGGLVMTGAGTSGNPYKVGLITTCADNELLKYTTAGGWACASDIDTDTDTDAQTLTWNSGTNSLSVSGGNSVNLSSLLDNTDNQTLNLAGNTLSLTNGGSVNLAGYLDNTDSQTLSWNGGTRTLSLTGGGSVVISDSDTTYSAGTGITLTGTTFSLTNDFGSSIDSSEITDGTIAAADLATSGATAGTYGDTGVNVTQLTVNNKGQVTAVSNRALPTANTTTTGVLSSGDWNTFNGKENVLTFTGNGLFSRAGNTITGIAGTVGGQVLKWNGSAWTTGTDNNTTYTNGNGLSLASTTFSINAPTCAGTTKLQWNGSAFLCSADVDTDTDTTNFNIRANAGASANIAAGNTVSFVDGTGTTASRSTNDISFSLTNVGTAGTYGSATAVPVITTDAQGRVTSVTSTPINFPAEVDGVIGNEVTNATANGGLARSGSGTSGSPYTLGLLTSCTDQQVLKYTLGTTTWGCANDTDTNTTYSAGTGLSLVGTTFSLTNDFGSSIDSSEITDGTIAAADLATSGATAGTYGDTGVNVTQLTVNNKGQVTAVSNRALPTANTTTTGVLSSGDWNTFNGKENVLTFTGNGLFSRAGNTITGIAGTVGGQVLKWNGSAWATGTDNDTTYTNGNGLSLSTGTFSINSPTCAGTTKLQWNGSAFVCSADVDTDTDTTNFNIRANAGASANIASGGTVSFVDGTGTSASRSSNDISFNLTNVGTAGTYGSATSVPVITTDAQGRITSVTDTPISFPAETDGVIGNEVVNATANGGLTRSGAGTSGSPYTLGLLTTCGDQQILKFTLGSATWACANDTDTNTTYTNGTGISLVGNTFSLTNDFGSSIDSSEITNGTVATADLATPSASNNTTFGDSGVNVANITVNDKGQVVSISNRTLPTANGTTTGVLSSGDWTTFNGKENVLTFTGNGLFSRAGNTITGIAGTVGGQVLKWNGSAWATGTDNDTTYSNGNGLSLTTGTFSINSPTCAGTTKLQWNGSAFVCSADVDTDTDTTNFNIRANAGVSANISAGNTVSFVDGTGTTASRSTNDISFSLTNVGTAGTYGSATQVPVITTDAQGRITGVVNTSINFPAEVDGVVGNEVTNATANGGLTRSGSGTGGSPYTLGLLTTCGDQQVLKYTLGTTTWGCANDNNTTYTNGTGLSLVGNTFSLTNDFGSSIDSSEITNGTVATADLAAPSASNNTTFGDSGVNVPNITVNDKGQVVSVSNRALPTANGTTTGVLSSGDWTTFNGKENVLTFTGNGLFSRSTNTVTGLAGTVNGQVIKWNGSAWVAGTDNGTAYTNGTGISITTGVISLDCAGTGASGIAFCQGGNSFGQGAVLGTNDANTLTLQTAGTDRFVLSSSATTLTGQGSTVLTSTGGITLSSAVGANGVTISSGNSGITASTTASTTDGITFNANSVTSATAFQLNATGLTTGYAFEITGPTETGGTGGNTMLRVKNDATQGFNQPQVTIGVGDTNNPDSLARDQLYVFGRINTSWQQQWSECLSGLASTTASTAGTLTPNGYIVGNTAAGTLQIGTAVSGSGICRLTTTSTTTAGQMNSLSGGTINSTQRQYNPVYEARVSGSIANGTTQRAVIGFTNRAIGGVLSTDATAVTTAANNFGLYGAFFRKNAADTTWSAVTTNNGTATTTTIAAATTNAFHRFRVEVDNIKTEVRFYVDGTLVATHTTNLPPATTFMGYGAFQGSSLTTAGTAITLDVDYMRVWSDDPPETAPETALSDDIAFEMTAGESDAVATTTAVEDEARAQMIATISEKMAGVVVAETGDIDQLQFATQLLARLTGQDKRIQDVEDRLLELETSAEALKDAVWEGGIVTKDTTFSGLVTFTQPVVFSGSNVGTLTVPAGETRVQVTLPSSLPSLAKVTASKQSFIKGDWRITEITQSGFVLELESSQQEPVVFDWHAFANQ